MKELESETETPWWRVRMVWFVIGGPAVVVVASLITLALAIHGADMPLHETAVSKASTAAPTAHAPDHAVDAHR